MLYEDGGACDVSSACAVCGHVNSVDSVEGRTLEIRNVLAEVTYGVIRGCSRLRVGTVRREDFIDHSGELLAG